MKTEGPGARWRRRLSRRSWQLTRTWVGFGEGRREDEDEEKGGCVEFNSGGCGNSKETCFVPVFVVSWASDGRRRGCREERVSTLSAGLGLNSGITDLLAPSGAVRGK